MSTLWGYYKDDAGKITAWDPPRTVTEEEVFQIGEMDPYTGEYVTPEKGARIYKKKVKKGYEKHKYFPPYIITTENNKAINWPKTMSTAKVRKFHVYYKSSSAPARWLNVCTHVKEGSRWKIRTFRKKVKCYSFTNLAAKWGFYPISAHGKLQRGYGSFNGNNEWWHFQYTGHLTKKSTLGNEFLQQYDEKVLIEALGDTWHFYKKCKFNGGGTFLVPKSAEYKNEKKAKEAAAKAAARRRRRRR